MLKLKISPVNFTILKGYVNSDLLLRNVKKLNLKFKRHQAKSKTTYTVRGDFAILHFRLTNKALATERTRRSTPSPIFRFIGSFQTYWELL